MILSSVITQNANKVARSCFLKSGSRLMMKEHHFQVFSYFRNFSSSIDKADNVFISINHSGKIREDDNETKTLLTPLQHKDNHDNHHHHHDHDHNHNDRKDNNLDDEMEQEDMFVAPDVSLGHNKIEWGGPRRGGRYEEPTRFGDWERKGRCTDF